MSIIFIEENFNSLNTDIINKVLLSGKSLKRVNVKLKKDSIFNCLKNFTPRKYARCKYKIKEKYISFTGCIDYGVKNYLLEVNKLKIQSLKEKDDQIIILSHQVLLFARGIRDEVLHDIPIEDLEGRRHRRYVQFYALVNGKEYIRTSYAIIKMKNYSNVKENKDKIILPNRSISIENLQPYIISVNGALSAITGVPMLELQNFINSLLLEK